MSKNYSGEGNIIDHVCVATQVSGVPFVLGKLLVMPITDGAIGDTIGVAIGGVWDLPKVDAAVIGQGETITYDVSVDEVDDALATPAAGDATLGCVAMEAKGATTGETIAVKLNVDINTIT